MPKADIAAVEGKLFYRKPIEETIRFLARLRSEYQGIHWFDNRDSAGNTQFEVLPHIDAYWKGQYYKDLSNYDKSFIHNRMHSDFFVRHYDLGEQIYEQDKELRAFEDEREKLKLSWNFGFGNFLEWGSLRETIQIYLLKCAPTPAFIDAGIPREIDIHCRFGIGTEPVYSRHRIHFKRIIEKMDLVTSGESIVPRAQFLDEIRRSKIVVSPFGWGELCYRDFEAVLNGACLVKPTVDHIKTWPDIFRAEETYVSVRWDLADLAQTIRDLLNDDKRRLAIVDAGQAELRELFSARGLIDFSLGHASKMLQSGGQHTNPKVTAHR
ncbi:glycosyltransferase [Stieleria sp. ICT_E10.1]|uniref:glycosyltransferase n=1 Tax=Stieleria sedimenti TaxID=2976331 RepID=UPI00217FBEA2|nr:glycosyltransferase [Stieleria sedimenti]MCS7466767.1 glycosyltransferase [Stieleria sedimenti]